MTRTLRIVHTSDWHLGHVLKRQSRAYEHRAFLDWLLGQLEELEADALLIAGDIFHTSNPSAAARRMFFDFIVELRDRVPGLTPVVIGGNHDSAAHLDAPDALFAALGVKVVGGLCCTDDGYDVERALMPIRSGDEVVAWVAAVPFLRRSDLSASVTRENGHAAAVGHAYRAVLDRARDLRTGDQPLIAMGHATMMGITPSEDSERRVICGGEEALPTEIFGADVSYVALGHLHLAQAVGDHEHVRYSGSPIPLSMTEESYEHQVLVADFEGRELTQVEALLVPRAVELVRFQHDEPLPIDETLEKLRTLSFPERPLEERPFLEVTVFLDRIEPNLSVEIREALGDAAVRLVGIRSHRPATASTCLGDVVQHLELSDLEPAHVFRLMHERAHTTAPDEALMRAFAELERRVDEAV